MEPQIQTQAGEYSISAIDAKEFLDYIAENPPEPCHNGCVKIALRSFLRSLQISGIYHEHSRYDEWEKSSKVSENSVLPTEKQNSLVALEDQLPAAYTSHQPTQQPNDTIYTDKEKFRTILAYNNDCFKSESCDIKRRNMTASKFSQDIFYITEVPSNGRISAENSQANADQNLAATPSKAEGTFLSRVALSEKQTAHDIMASLSYGQQGANGKTKHQKEEKVRHKKSMLRTLWSDRTYAFIILVLMWAYGLRAIMFFFLDYDILLLTKLVPTLWCLMVSATNTAAFVSCVRSDHLSCFFFRWVTLFQDLETRSLGIRGMQCTKYLKIVLAVKWLVVVVNTTCCVFIMVMDDKFSAGMNIVMYITGQRSLPVIALSGVAIFFCSLGWIGIMTFIIVLCHHVCTHFWEFRQVLKLHIAAASDGFPQRLKLLRERHLAMCETVSVLDRFVGIVNAIIYSVTIALLCLLLYHLVNVPMDTSVTVVGLTWSTTSISFMAVVTHYMANVNIAMHSVSDDLYTIQTSNMTLEQQTQLQMFLAKVNGANMGFTVLGLVVVTRELMLTLFGLLLTYGVVLLQFK